MKVNVTYTVSRQEGRRTVKEKRTEVYEVADKYIRGEGVTADGHYFIAQILNVKEKLRCGGTVSEITVGPDDALAREKRREAAIIATMTHMQRKNRDSERVKNLEQQCRRKYGLAYFEPLSFDQRREIEIAYAWNTGIS